MFHITIFGPKACRRNRFDLLNFLYNREADTFCRTKLFLVQSTRRWRHNTSVWRRKFLYIVLTSTLNYVLIPLLTIISFCLSVSPQMSPFIDRSVVDKQVFEGAQQDFPLFLSSRLYLFQLGHLDGARHELPIYPHKDVNLFSGTMISEGNE